MPNEIGIGSLASTTRGFYSICIVLLKRQSECRQKCEIYLFAHIFPLNKFTRFFSRKPFVFIEYYPFVPEPDGSDRN